MSHTTDPFEPLRPIPEMADLLGLTERRLRQFVEAGAIPRPERGKIDFGWAVHYFGGAKMTESLEHKPAPGVLVALAWATGQGADATAQRAHLIGLFERNGKTRDEALLALGHAQALLNR